MPEMQLLRSTYGKTYRFLRATKGRLIATAKSRAEIKELAGEPAFPEDADFRILIGPENSAGASFEWARAASALELPSGKTVAAKSIQVAVAGGFHFSSDITIGPHAYAGNLQGWKARVLDSATHVILESGNRITGKFRSGESAGEIAELQERGIHVALLFHGSDIRQAQLHSETVSDSPLTETGKYWDSIRTRAANNYRLACDFTGPIFVSTPGLVPHAPNSEWLPLTVDTATYHPDTVPLCRSVPVVTHAPSNPKMKGTTLIEPILEKLDQEGVVEYRRLSGVPHTQMADFIQETDILVDQVVLGDYGVLACEAMAAGRLVLASVNVAQETMPKLPIVHCTAATLESTIRQAVADRAASRERAAQGPDFVAHFHDGTYAGKVLAAKLNLR